MSLLTQFYDCGGGGTETEYAIGGSKWYASESTEGGIAYVYNNDPPANTWTIVAGYDTVRTKRIFGQNFGYGNLVLDATKFWQNTIESIRGLNISTTNPAYSLYFEAGSQLQEFVGGLYTFTGTLDFSACTSLTTVKLSSGRVVNGGTITFNGCSLTQASVDNILAACAYGLNQAGSGVTTGTLDLGGAGNAAPSAAGVTARTQLLAYGITVTTN